MRQVKDFSKFSNILNYLANPQKISFLMKAVKLMKDRENNGDISACPGFLDKVCLKMVLDDSTSKAFMANNNIKQEKQTNPEQHPGLC